MVTIRLIVMIFGGIFFSILGYAQIKKRNWFGGIFILSIGLYLFYTPTLGPLSNSKERILAITQIDSSKVKNIILVPSKNKNVKTIKSKIIIDDRVTINKLCKSLHNSIEEGEGYMKSPEWRCIIEVELITNEKFLFGVRRLNKVTGLGVDSRGESGYHYGNLRSDDFGLEIEKLIK